MKKVLVVLSLMLMSIVANSAVKNDRFHLVLEGKFISEKNVTYELYKMDEQNKIIQECSLKGKKYFSVQVDVGARYVMKFTSESGLVKYLNIEVQTNGYLAIDIDFNNDNSATLVYNKHYGYDLKHVEEEKIWYVSR